MARAERVLTSHYIVYIHTSVQLGELWTVLNASLIQQRTPRTIYEATSENHHGFFPGPKNQLKLNLLLTGFMCLRGILVIWSTKIFKSWHSGFKVQFSLIFNFVNFSTLSIFQFFGYASMAIENHETFWPIFNYSVRGDQKMPDQCYSVFRRWFMSSNQ